MDRKKEAIEYLQIGIPIQEICVRTGLSRFQVYRLKQRLIHGAEQKKTVRRVAAAGRGRNSRMLRKDQIERLQKFRIERRLSMPALNAAINGVQYFSWQVLQRALSGAPVWDLNHRYISQWIEDHLPANPPARDGKALAAGEAVEG